MLIYSQRALPGSNVPSGSISLGLLVVGNSDILDQLDLSSQARSCGLSNSLCTDLEVRKMRKLMASS